MGAADERPRGWDADQTVWQRVTRIVRRKYKGKPVGPKAVASAMGRRPGAIAYALVEAAKRGVLQYFPGRGYAPVDAHDVEVLGPMYRRAADLVVAEYRGEPVRTIDVAEKLEVRWLTASKALKKAEGRCLVKCIARNGWIPVDSPSE